MSIEEARIFILRLVRPAGRTGLRPCGIAAQLRASEPRRKASGPSRAEAREHVMWLVERGYLEKFSPAISPAEARVRITAAGIDYLDAAADF